jgi:transcriptional regulator with XRE-family HTH domain
MHLYKVHKTQQTIFFGNTLRRLREKANLSQEELADRSGLHRTYVGSVERGERNISLENIVRLAKALGKRPNSLLEDL